jgi:hypothetical protein
VVGDAYEKRGKKQVQKDQLKASESVRMVKEDEDAFKNLLKEQS